MFQGFARVAKALTAAAGAASAAAVTAAQDGTVNQLDWLTILVAGVTVGYATWQVRNRPAVPVAPDGPLVDEHAGDAPGEV